MVCGRRVAGYLVWQVFVLAWYVPNSGPHQCATTVGHISGPHQWATSVCATSWSEMNLESPTVPNLDPSVNYEETLAGNTRNTWSLMSVQKPHYIDGPNGV